jgi:hypothetical protein
MFADQTRNLPERPYVKVRLGRNQQSHEVVQIVDDWRSRREAAPKVGAALRLYDALERGDLETLQEFLPLMGAGLAVLLSGGNGLASLFASAPAVSPAPVVSLAAPVRVSMPAPEIVHVQKSEEEDTDDFLDSLGFDANSLFG